MKDNSVGTWREVSDDPLQLSVSYLDTILLAGGEFRLQVIQPVGAVRVPVAAAAAAAGGEDGRWVGGRSGSLERNRYQLRTTTASHTRGLFTTRFVSPGPPPLRWRV
jgi:hypothetical protein